METKWSWLDYLETPQPIIDAAYELLNAKSEAAKARQQEANG